MVRCVWASISPGSTVAFGSSIRTASEGILASADALLLTIFPSSIRIVWSASMWPDFTSSRCPACTATRPVWAPACVPRHNQPTASHEQIFFTPKSPFPPGFGLTIPAISAEPAVETPHPAGVRGVKDNQQQQERDVIQFGTKITPERHS